MTRRTAPTHIGSWTGEWLRGSSGLWLGLPLLAAVTLAVVAQVAPDFYAKYLEPELGILEILHVLQNATTAVLAAILLARPEVRRVPWFAAWVALALAGSVYTTGEEASWGQHIFAWSTPETWRRLNDQGETNLHNVSSWFDQKPRLVLELAILGARWRCRCCAGPASTRAIRSSPIWSPRRTAYPPRQCWPWPGSRTRCATSPDGDR